MKIKPEYSAQDIADAVKIKPEYSAQEIADAVKIKPEYSAQEIADAVKIKPEYSAQEIADAVKIKPEYSAQDIVTMSSGMQNRSDPAEQTHLVKDLEISKRPSSGNFPSSISNLKCKSIDDKHHKRAEAYDDDGSAFNISWGKDTSQFFAPTPRAAQAAAAPAVAGDTPRVTRSQGHAAAAGSGVLRSISKLRCDENIDEKNKKRAEGVNVFEVAPPKHHAAVNEYCPLSSCTHV